MGAFQRHNGVAADIYIALLKTSGDQALTADWTPVAGDVQIIKDGGAAANITTLPTAIATTNGTSWKFHLTATEMTAGIVAVVIADAATKAIQDDCFDVETLGVTVGTDGVGAASISTAGYTAIAASMGGAVDDAFLTDHTIAGTIAEAISDILAAVTTGGVPINSTGLAAVLAAAIPEPTGPPSFPISLAEGLAWLTALAQNQMADSGDIITVRNATNTADLATASVVDDGTTTTRSAFS